MATLTDENYSELRNTVYRKGQGKEEMKALPSLPSKAQLKGAFQALEDWWQTQKPLVKADIDTAYGQTTSATLAKFIFKAFFLWKTRGW